jgi:hypothetical protein
VRKTTGDNPKFSILLNKVFSSPFLFTALVRSEVSWSGRTLWGAGGRHHRRELQGVAHNNQLLAPKFSDRKKALVELSFSRARGY